MEPWALIITALGGLTGLAGLVTAVSTASTSARKTELDALRQTIDELQEENLRLRKLISAQDVRIAELENENRELRSLARPKGLARR